VVRGEHERVGVAVIIEVAIGPGLEAGKFRVEVVASAAGDASAVVELDIGSLLDRRELLEKAVLASAVSSRRLLPETEQPVREVGESLFAALLGAGEVAGLYRAAAAIAATQGERLRVVLRIDAPALAGLPWEAMYDQAAGSYVCRRDQLVRHVPVSAVAAPLRVQPPLRILGVVSSPRGLPPLSVEKEQDQLGRALARPVSQGLAELYWAPSATWADLQDLLLDGEWHVLHFIGHGDFDPSRNQGVLALVREDGRVEMVAAHRMVDLLRQAHPMPRLVVLNSCSGAVTGVSDLFSGTAATLVRGGVSAVAAMQYEISDSAAIAFARGFYAAIARGRGVDDAVSSGRVAILGLSDRTMEWVTPVLYLRGHESQLFTLTGSGDDTGLRSKDSSETRNSPDIAGHGPYGTSVADRAGAPPRRSAPATGAPGRPSPAPSLSRLARILAGHTSYVTGVAFRPDGSLLATASGDHTVQLWDTRTGASVRTLIGHDEGVTGVAFSPDGSLLATVSGDLTARLWQVASGTPLRTTRTGHASYVTGVAFSPDGSMLATAGWDPTVRLWDVGTGAPLRTFTSHTAGVSGVVFSPDGALLAAADDDGTAQLWDAATGASVRTFIGHDEGVTRVAFSPDGSLLATASEDRTARLWDVATGAPVHTFTGHSEKVFGLAFSPDGSLLVTVSEDRTARLQEVATGMLLSTVTAHDYSVSDVAFSADGTMLATASGDGTARLWT
jgi:WD40 repeat protein